MKGFVNFTVVSPPIVDGEPNDNVGGDEEYIEGEEDVQPEGQKIVRDNGRAIEDDIEEDEGYEKWGLP